MNINIMNIGCFNNCCVNIKIFDNNCKLIVNDHINRLTYYNLCNGIYVIKVYINYNLLGIYSIIHRYDNEIINLCLNNSQRNTRIFYLYDYFYKGLKIKRGELILGT